MAASLRVSRFILAAAAAGLLAALPLRAQSGAPASPASAAGGGASLGGPAPSAGRTAGAAPPRLDEALLAALSRSPELALQAARLCQAEETLAATEPWRGSALSLGGGFDGNPLAPEAKEGTWSAALSFPFASWASLALSGTGDLAGGLSASASLSASPFAQDRAAPARESLRSETLAYRQQARALVLALRASLRALDSARAELALRETALARAEAARDKAALLRERGEGTRSAELDAAIAAVTARVDLDKARSTLAEAEASLVRSLGPSPFPEAPYALERLEAAASSLGEAAWLAAHAKVAQAELALAQAERSATEAETKPDLSLKFSLAQRLGAASSPPPAAAQGPSLGLSATLRLPAELLVGEAARGALAVVEARRLAFVRAKEDALAELAQKRAELSRLASSLAAARDQDSQAALALEEAEFLHGLGERSTSDLLAAKELRLKSRLALVQTEARLADALDALDPALIRPLLD